MTKYGAVNSLTLKLETTFRKANRAERVAKHEHETFVPTFVNNVVNDKPLVNNRRVKIRVARESPRPVLGGGMVKRQFVGKLSHFNATQPWA